MAISQLRKTDERLSNMINNIMDKNVYGMFMENTERVTDKQRQVQGIDVIFEHDGKKYICDEKSSVRYINKRLNTFAFEISFINRGDNLQKGWLVDEHKINDSFMLIYPDKAEKDIPDSEEEFLKTEAILVRKQAILEYLESIGWTVDKLIEKSKRIRNNPDEYMGNMNRDGIKFSYSRQLVEQPINVLILRDKLRDISDWVFEI